MQRIYMVIITVKHVVITNAMGTGAMMLYNYFTEREGRDPLLAGIALTD